MENISSKSKSTVVIGFDNLPELAIAVIIHKLECLPDCVRFASVCSTWRSAAKSVAKHDNKRFPVPMLLLPTVSTGARKILTLDLYSFAENRIYTVPFPFLLRHNTLFCGYSHGWLAIVETDLSITLLKPTPKFSTRNDVVRLPPIRARVDHLPIKEVRLSADPSTCRSYTVTVFFHQYQKLTVFKSGGRDWVYPLTNNVQALARHRCVKVPIYIATSSGGEVLQIELYHKVSQTIETTLTSLRVMELRPIPWRIRNDVGGDALFLGDNCTVIVAASDVVRAVCCNKDCLYYVNDDYKLCVFSLKTLKSEILYHLNPSKPMPPIWITPALSADWV